MLALAAAPVQAGDNPVADSKAVVVSGNARFTMLTPRMIRIEYSPSGRFEDNATFAIVNRNLDVPKYSLREDKDFINISTAFLDLRYRKGSDPRETGKEGDNLLVKVRFNGTETDWFPGKKDTLNLLGTCRTLDGSYGDNKLREMEQGLVSRSGWSVIDDSPSTLRADGGRSFAFRKGGANNVDWVTCRTDPEAMDLYFLGYGHDYKAALYDFTRVAGKIPLPPAYVFGYWYSRYDSYTSDDFRNIIKNLKENDIPCDVMILDMDWHYNGDMKDSGGRGGWTGWTWNRNLIPDPEELLKDIHGSGMKVALNLHPADGIAPDEDYYTEICRDLGMNPDSGKNVPWMLEDNAFYKSMFSNIIRKREQEGVDFWWLDWQQHLTNPRFEGLSETFWCNHVFFNDMKSMRPDRRPVIFHRWGGLGSHRYQIGFSGDACITYPTLAFQPYFTATASNVGYGYWGHDLGGHLISDHPCNDPELFLRWIQFGVFTPIFRTHSQKSAELERRIWMFDNFPLMRDAVKLRYALFPYIYTMARKTYDTGVSLCRPLYYEYPELEEAYANKGEYFFGDDILVSPVVTPSANGVSQQRVWLPEGNWWCPWTNRMIQGNGYHTSDYTLAQIPYFIKEGSVIVTNHKGVSNVTDHPDRYIVKFIAGKDGKTSLYEDNGDNQDYDSNCAFTDIEQRHKGKKSSFIIHPRRGNGIGLPTDRSYCFEIYNTTAPRRIKVNGRTHTDFTYDKSASCTRVEIPSVSCADRLNVSAEW